MDWKIIAALVVAVAIVVSGFLASGGINFAGTGANPIGDFLTGAKDAVSNILSGTASEKDINRTLRVSGSLSIEDGLLKLNSPASSVEIGFNTPASMNVGSEIIQLSDGETAVIGNFSGMLDIYANNTVLIDGNAETIYVSNIGILPHAQKTVSIKSASSARSIRVYNISVGSLNLNVSGSLDIGQGKVAIKAESEPLQIENFKGNLDISGASLAIEGLSEKVLLNREKISVG